MTEQGIMTEQEEYKRRMQEKKEKRRMEGQEQPKTRPPRVAICTPSNDFCNIDFADCRDVMQMYTLKAIKDFELVKIGRKGILIDFNRNFMVQEALRHQCTHIFFIDTDMTFPHDILVKLLLHRKDIIGCNCCTRVPPIKMLAADLQGNIITPEQTGLIEVSRVGTGVLLISTQVFTKLLPPWFDAGWDDEYADEGVQKNYLQVHSQPGGIDIGVYVGEDLYFCDKVRKTTNFKMWVDNDLSKKVGHQGIYTIYPTRKWLNFTVDANGDPMIFDSTKEQPKQIEQDFGWVKK